MGGAKRRQGLTLKPASPAVTEAMGWVDAAGGKLQVRWNEAAAVAPFGQMAFFIEFLNLAGVLDAWMEDCPSDLCPGSNHPLRRQLPDLG